MIKMVGSGMILLMLLCTLLVLINGQSGNSYDSYWRMTPHQQQQQFYSQPQQMFSTHSMVHTRQAPMLTNSETIVAIAKLEGPDGVRGIVQFNTMPGRNDVQVSGRITGLTAGDHGFHIHQFGDTRDGCKSMGGHYNPEGHNHGARTDQARHVGDLGNIQADQNGVAEFNFGDHKISLNGAHSILGRGVVVHAKQDDLGRGGVEESRKTGNAGGRVACGVVAIAKQ